MRAPEPPPTWGSDTVSDFIENARQNLLASYVRLKPAYRLLAEVDEVFRGITTNLLNPPDWFVCMFLLRAHSSYLGAVHLGLAGQLPESYMLLRGVLENAVYGFYFHLVPDSHERWLRRHDDAKAMRVVRDEFRIAAMLRLLRTHHDRIGAAAITLYERTIDFGAHPNERAVTQVLRLTQNDDQRRLDISYLTGHGTAMDLCLRSGAQAGVCALEVFRRVWPERFDLLGLPEQLQRVSEGL